MLICHTQHVTFFSMLQILLNTKYTLIIIKLRSGTSISLIYFTTSIFNSELTWNRTGHFASKKTALSILMNCVEHSNQVGFTISVS